MNGIAVIRALQLGDLLVAVPALRSLRAGYPRARITLLGLPWAADFVTRFSRYVDRFVEFEGYPGIAEAPCEPARTARFLREQRAERYDLVVQLHGDGTISNRLARDLGGRLTAGYYRDKLPDGFTAGAPYPDHLPEVLRNLALARLVGGADVPADLEFPLFERDRSEAAALLSGLSSRATGPAIGIHPGARSAARRWPAERFAALADALAERAGASVVLTGAADEEELVRAVAASMTTRPVIAAGKTSLGGLAALIERLDLFVSNDTGPAHIAVACGTRSVTIFSGAADHQRWEPLDRARHRVVRRAVPCAPCGHAVCPIDHRCLTWIAPDEVLEVALEMLGAWSVPRLEELHACSA
jgi:ADP-heptose:LPS heptosyltransferase